VLETDHTVILGWSDAVFAILRELCIANESRKRPAIVVLAERDKVEMETEIRARVPDLLGTRIVCRTGSPMDLGDLALTNLECARSAIVLSPGGDDPDSEVLKTLLALTREDGGLADSCHVVVEIYDPSNLDAARLVSRQRATIVDKRETIARLIVQTSRQSGAAAVYRELFDFEGDEIYFHRDSALSGATFGDARVAYESVSVIGLAGPDGVRLNPPGATPIGDQELVVIAEDDSVLERLAHSTTAPQLDAVNTAVRTPDASKRLLLLGWNERASTVVRELDLYATRGSSIDVLTELGEPDLPELHTLKAEVAYGRTSDRTVLERYPITEYDHIVVLAYSDHLTGQHADARTLVTLLHLRDIVGDRVRGDGPSVVSEMLDDRNRALAQVAHVDDVIVSDEILSLIVSQLSEDARLGPVFTDLLDSGGAEIYLRPATDYVRSGQSVTYRTVVEAAAMRGETAIGYRVANEADDPGAAYGIYVNPPKSHIYAVDGTDRVVVLADQ
jgi:voltage-gated potassium channel Kch